jgi:hypothetical protein
MLKTPFLTALLAAALVVPALAQTAPNDTGAGLERGLQAVNSSGQVGSVTVFRTSGNPTLVVDVKGSANHPEAVTIARGRSCDALDLSTKLPLGNLQNGRLRATSPISSDRLLSGNYYLVVHNNTPTSRPVLCGQLYVR